MSGGFDLHLLGSGKMSVVRKDIRPQVMMWAKHFDDRLFKCKS